MYGARVVLGFGAVLGSGVGLWVSCGVAWAQDLAPMVYDKPIKTEVVTFMDQMPPYNGLPGAKIKATVTCSYYPRFVVEEVHDDGDEGEGIFTVPLTNDRDPPCENPGVSDLKGVAGVGAGWLAGVTNDLVVTAGPDTFDDGTGVTIFRALDHKVLLSDLIEVGDRNQPLISAIKKSKAGIEVRYDRIFSGDCSVAAKGAACVDIFSEQTGIDARNFAKCAADYRLMLAQDLRGRCTKSGGVDQRCVANGLTPAEERSWNDDPTAIAYGVQVFIPNNELPVQLSGDVASLAMVKGASKAGFKITAVGGVLACFPSE
jgi:hypothetical protein